MNKPINSSIINVCIIPNETVSASCVTLSQSLKTDSAILTLGNGKFAHMTVYMARFSDDAINDVVSAVEKVLSQTSSFECKHIGYFLTKGRYYEASFDKNVEFMALHGLLIDNVSPLRINPGNPYEEGYFTPYTEGQQKNAAETGYDLAYELYRPHITLTRYAEGGVPDPFPEVAETNLSFNTSKICVYKADDNGAVYELVKEFII